MVSFALISGQPLTAKANIEKTTVKNESNIDLVKLQEKVFPASGYTFQVSWGDLGKKMVEDGVIDDG